MELSGLLWGETGGKGNRFCPLLMRVFGERKEAPCVRRQSRMGLHEHSLPSIFVWVCMGGGARLNPGGLSSISCSVLAPSSPSVTSQSLRITASPRHPCSGPESRQEAGRSLRGEKGPREWKEEAAEATRCKKYREPPRAPRPSPFRVRTHPTSSRSPAGSSGTHRWTSR